jgi:Mg/Co/Ni transporter MgtE
VKPVEPLKATEFGDVDFNYLNTDPEIDIAAKLNELIAAHNELLARLTEKQTNPPIFLKVEPEHD